MKRREFFEKASVGSAALASLPTLAHNVVTPARAHESRETNPHQHQSVSGPLANATMIMGLWQTDPPLDRFPNSSPANRNHHQLIPYEVTIRAGGAINFVISGLHQIAVYGDGTQPTDINASDTVSPTGAAAPPLINDPNNRIYRGLDPTLLPRDRVEVVHFPNPGTYLVICTVVVHFVRDGMFGFVTVLP